MATRVYGCSDDLIEFEGDLYGEVGASYNDAKLVAFSDGTILTVRYGKPDLGGVWGITVLREGDLFDRIEICNDEDAEVYSDEVFFKDGKLKAWTAESPAKVA